MTPASLDDPLTGLAPIALDDLVEVAGLQTRVDRKYLVPLDSVRSLLTALPPGTQVLEIDDRRIFAYESVYFDTPDLLSYRLAAHRRRRRFKVRTRTYLDSDQCWLEVKTHGARGATVKDRLPYVLDGRFTVDQGRRFVADVLAVHGVHALGDLPLLPTLVTRYLRTTLFLPDTTSRVTVDVDLSWQHDTSPLQLQRFAVVETKTGSTASGADRLLWADGYRPVRISKYATGLAALRPELPASRWHRTLNRHLLPHMSPLVPSGAPTT